MSTIRILSEAVVGRIAAGEVVERPASVVKELLENALDAGARAIRVSVEDAGLRRLQVEDDGSGMDRADATLAFVRHATSKLESDLDLDRVSTLGFRGEALASIASVARVELTTAQQPGDGVRVTAAGGGASEPEPIGRPRGTTVTVSDLFFNVPARREFLKSPATELRWITEVVQGAALARPEVGFRLESGRRTLIDAPASTGDEPVLERIGRLFGREFQSDLSSFSRGWAGGYLGGPDSHRGRRQFVFVNRRPLRDRLLLASFYRAVRDVWKTDRFPALFLYLDLPPDSVDVNVHPQKAEVRFRDSGLARDVGGLLRSALEERLGEIPAPVRTLEEPPEGGMARPAWVGLGGTGGGHDGREIAEAVYSPIASQVIPLSGRAAKTPSLRLLGQYKGTLILLEGPDSLYLIDQHVAHERILYERLRKSFSAQEVEAQVLLQPLLLELGPGESARLLEHVESLERSGFALRQLSGETLALNSVPDPLDTAEAEEMLRRLAGGEFADAEDLGQRLLDVYAASKACRAAVKMHEPLTGTEMQRLVQELFEAENPWTCPHGRPVVLEMTDRDLESRFGRR